MRNVGRHPDGPCGRYDPKAISSFHRHDAGRGMDELSGVVVMGRNGLIGLVVLGQPEKGRRQRKVDERAFGKGSAF